MIVVLRYCAMLPRYFNGSMTDSESSARQMVFYLSHFAGASPNNSQMSHLITRPILYAAASSLAARNDRSTSSCQIFHERAYQDAETLAIGYHGESRLAPSS